MPRVRIQTEDFDLSQEVEGVRHEDRGVGAVAAFVGTVRDADQGRSVQALELEHYPGMTERAIESMIDEALRRFPVRAARVVHRVGRLEAAERIVLVVVTAAHRHAAFQACEFLMDYLKTQAPFWKKETTPDGERWVDARVADDQALSRWGLSSGNAAR
jgi:molybdopterin synthase catalytic subunit